MFARNRDSNEDSEDDGFAKHCVEEIECFPNKIVMPQEAFRNNEEEGAVRVKNYKHLSSVQYDTSMFST